MPRYICTDTCQWPDTRLNEQGSTVIVDSSLTPPAHCFKFHSLTETEQAEADKAATVKTIVASTIEVDPAVLEPNIFEE